MKKTLLILLTSLLYVFNGNAQCNINGGMITLNNQYICQNTFALFASVMDPTNISSNVSYQWEINGMQIFGQNQGGMCNFTINSNYGGTGSVRRKVTDLVNSCSAYSNTITFTIWPQLSSGSTLGDDTLCSGNISSVINSNSLPTGGPQGSNNPGYDYFWQQSTNGINWTDISGATNTTYAPGALTATTLFRRNDGSSACGYYLYGNIITQTVMNCGTFTSDITGPTTITPNQTATYSVTPVDGMKYVWAVSGGTITGGQGTYTITIMWDGGASANSRTTAAAYSVSVTETDATPESRTTSKTITATTTDINKGFATSGISVFPNPIKNQFIVEMPTVNTSVNYTVYTTTGIPVQSGSFNAVSSGNTIESHLRAGMYQLVLNYDGIFTSTRLVVVE